MSNDTAIDAYVERVVAAAPPLTEAQRSKLAELLRPARISTTAVRGAAA